MRQTAAGRHHAAIVVQNQAADAPAQRVDRLDLARLRPAVHAAAERVAEPHASVALVPARPLDEPETVGENLHQARTAACAAATRATGTRNGEQET